MISSFYLFHLRRTFEGVARRIDELLSISALLIILSFAHSSAHIHTSHARDIALLDVTFA